MVASIWISKNLISNYESLVCSILRRRRSVFSRFSSNFAHRCRFSAPKIGARNPDPRSMDCPARNEKGRCISNARIAGTCILYFTTLFARLSISASRSSSVSSLFQSIRFSRIFPLLARCRLIVFWSDIAKFTLLSGKEG